MIERKEIFLWVLENGEPVKKPLLEVDFTERKRHSLEKYLYDEIPAWHYLNFDQKLFASAYLETITEMTTEFEEVIKLKFSNNPDLKIIINNIYEGLKNVDLAFADTNAYKQKTNITQGDKEIIESIKSSSGYFCRNEGIVLKLKYYRSINKTCESLIHEYGHYFDCLLNLREYHQKTATMKEVMAFLTEDNFHHIYEPNSKLHNRAYHLLKSLEQTSFKYMTFAEKWLFLNPLLDHKKAKEYFQKHLERLPPILPTRF